MSEILTREQLIQIFVGSGGYCDTLCSWQQWQCPCDGGSTWWYLMTDDSDQLMMLWFIAGDGWVSIVGGQRIYERKQ